ncbi:hypothetical protein DEA8626_03030 [Defluviimonas aquaemixtae]|uniref:Phage tail protein domain-containing protein n=1 Tax=Albidovulum aquaemixtae TaxID=1542388 RepID=A0A2R8BKW0_9RHOB|nr:hypothetical protein [Defluviimonas aquaemixtae]SPH23953.1 hypothetical protein DEA8626_03030 [Defluviimonas aquaemixtae]
MTHPRDRVYRFETAAQWGAGAGVGLVLREEAGGVARLDVPGAPVAERLPGTTDADARALLARDPAGRLIWLRRDGGVFVDDDGRAIRLARIPPGLAGSATRLIWGQRFGWVLAEGQIVRIDTATGQRLGVFAQDGWQPEGIAADTCDGLLIVERRDEERRLRRLRSDGVSHPETVELPAKGRILVGKSATDGRLRLVRIDPGDDEGWTLIVVDLAKRAFVPHEKEAKPKPDPEGPVALRDGGAVALKDAEDGGIFEAGPGHVGPVLKPLWNEGACKIGHITDLQSDGDCLVASTETGLWRICDSHEASSARRVAWLSPVLRSPLGERSGWQRADLTVVAPEGAEITIAACGFTGAPHARATRQDVMSTELKVFEDAGWDATPISRHYGRGGSSVCRHYLGEIGAEFLLLRVTVEVPACAGPASLGALRVLYPDRSLIEHLPAIYRDGARSERQMRRALAGFQAVVDDIDDKITAATDRVDPATADPLWSRFLLHWLGHGDLSRLPFEKRRALLADLPGAMQMRGTRAGLERVMESLAPGAFAIEDGAEGPADWLLPAADDPAGGRLGRDTRLPKVRRHPWTLGCTAPLGTGRLGRDCGVVSGTLCSATITVRLFGSAKLKEELSPFTAAIARNFAPANTRVRCDFTAHDPRPGLGLGPAVGEITLGPDDSRALGAWTLPDAGTRSARPDEPARLDQANLNGNLVLE